MIPLVSIALLLGQMPLTDSGSPAITALRHHSRPVKSGRHGECTPPSVRVTIVNATCSPTLSLSVTGTNGPPAYPLFAQGEWTADAPFTNPVVDYAARDTNGLLLRGKRIIFPPVSKQYLLITGDLSRGGDPEHLPGVGVNEAPLPPSSMIGGKEIPSRALEANLQFHVIPCEGVVKDPSHYRIVNCIPRSTLIIRKPPEGGRPARELACLTPGNSVLLTGQPESVNYEVEVLGSLMKLEILQEGAVADCLIPFYLREGKVAYSTIFESP